MFAPHRPFRRLLTQRLGTLLLAVLAASAGAPNVSFAAGEAGTDSQLPEGPPAAIITAKAQAQSSLTATDVAQRDALLGKAQAGIEAFLKDNPTSPEAPYAELELGLVHVNIGLAAVADSRRTADPAEREALLAKGRERFVAGEKLFTTVYDQLNQIFKTFPKVNFGFDKDNPARRHGERLRGEFVRVQMLHAGVLEELAATYPLESRDARVNYQAAADRYESIYKNYRTLVAGLKARLKQGQCHQNLGDPRRALGLFTDILGQPDHIPQLHRMRVQAMYLSLECWNSEQEKMHELAFTEGEGYLTKLPRNEELWPEWQAVRFHTAQGYLLAATTKKKDGKLPDDRADWLAKAREHAEKLGEQSGPYKAAVEALLNQIKKSETVDIGESRLGRTSRTKPGRDGSFAGVLEFRVGEKPSGGFFRG
jgi:hypothetical protein